MITIVIMRSSLSGMRRLIEAHEKKKWTSDTSIRGCGYRGFDSNYLYSIYKKKNAVHLQRTRRRGRKKKKDKENENVSLTHTLSFTLIFFVLRLQWAARYVSICLPFLSFTHPFTVFNL